MGGFASSVQQPQTNGQPSGKGQPTDFAQPATQEYQQPPRPMGKGGRQTNSATSGQPTMGAPNQYPNTVGQWDNSQIQPLPSKNAGKGKGG
jgi:hypothetical protein